jgi:hypothetical protein
MSASTQGPLQTTQSKALLSIDLSAVHWGVVTHRFVLRSAPFQVNSKNTKLFRKKKLGNLNSVAQNSPVTLPPAVFIYAGWRYAQEAAWQRRK